MISDLELLQAVREETSEEFVVYGELGREESAGVALLALERATNALVVLLVTTTASSDGDVELGVDVRTELDARVPDVGTYCVSCGTRLRPWGRFCPNCGLDVLGQVGATDADPAEMRAAVEESITGDYELLGEMKRKEGGGRVYFAREKSSGRIAALRLSQGVTDGEFELGETRVIKKSRMADAGMSLSVTQLLRTLEASDAPAAAVPTVSSALPAPAAPATPAAPPVKATPAAPPAKAAPAPPAARAVTAAPTAAAATDRNAAARPAAPIPQKAPAAARPKRGVVAEGTAWAKRNWGPLAGVGVGAILALLGWIALGG